MSYINLFCQRGARNDCGAPVHLIVSEVRDAFGTPIVAESGGVNQASEQWTLTSSTWRLECENGHLLADADDLYPGDDYPPLPTVRFAMWDVAGITEVHTPARPKAGRDLIPPPGRPRPEPIPPVRPGRETRA